MNFIADGDALFLLAFSLACFEANWLALQIPLMSSSSSKLLALDLNSSKLGKAPWEWLRNLDMDSLFFIPLEDGEGGWNLLRICFVIEDLRYLSWTAALILDLSVENEERLLNWCASSWWCSSFPLRFLTVAAVVVRLLNLSPVVNRNGLQSSRFLLLTPSPMIKESSITAESPLAALRLVFGFLLATWKIHILWNLWVKKSG